MGNRPVRSLTRGAGCIVAIVLLTLIAGCAALGRNRPRVQSATPNQVLASRGAFLLIRGDNFAHDAVAEVDGIRLGDVTWVNAHLLTAELPPGIPPGAHDLVVSNSGGNSFTLRRAIQVQSASGQAQTAAATATAPSPNAADRAPSAAGSAQVATAQRSTSAATVTPVVTTQRPTAAPTGTTVATAQSPPPAGTQSPVGITVVRSPTPTPVPSAPATRAPAPAGPVPNIAGTWQIVDMVQYGPGTGEQYPFVVSIQQSGEQITGSGSGLALQGTVRGSSVIAAYRQDNGSTGTFTWNLDASGSVLQGSFDNTIGNGGSSTGRRIGGEVMSTARSWCCHARARRMRPRPKKKGH